MEPHYWSEYKQLQNSKHVAINSNKIYYPSENIKVVIGCSHSTNCICDAKKQIFKIDKTFRCTACNIIHQNDCCTTNKEELTGDNYWNTKCLACLRDWN